MTKQRASYIRGDVHGFRIFLKKMRKKYKVAGPLICIVILTLIVLYDKNGRYNKTDIEGTWSREYTYFGQVKNNEPHGWGKLFDKKDNIYYVGAFENGEFNGESKEYALSDDNKIYLTYQGNYTRGKRCGFGKEWKYINGKERLIYEGNFLENAYNGYGTLLSYDSQGRKWLQYEGGWAYGLKYGYGEKIQYYNDDDNKSDIIRKYRGTYWNDHELGTGITEYIEDGVGLVFHGWHEYKSDNIIFSEDGCYYYGNGAILTKKENHTKIDNSDKNGTDIDDAQKIDELSKKWPYPEDCIWKK